MDCQVNEKIYLGKDNTYLLADGSAKGLLRHLRLREESNWWNYEEIGTDGSIVEVAR